MWANLPCLVFINKVLLKHSHPFIYRLSIAAFMLQQNWIVTTKAILPAKSKIFIIGPLLKRHAILIFHYRIQVSRKWFEIRFFRKFLLPIKIKVQVTQQPNSMVLLLHEQYLYISWTWKIIILQKERQEERKLKAISLLNIIIKIKFHPWNKPKLALRFSL